MARVATVYNKCPMTKQEVDPNQKTLTKNAKLIWWTYSLILSPLDANVLRVFFQQFLSFRGFDGSVFI